MSLLLQSSTASTFPRELLPSLARDRLTGPIPSHSTNSVAATDGPGRRGGALRAVRDVAPFGLLSVARPNPARTLATRPVRIGPVRSTPPCFGCLIPDLKEPATVRVAHPKR